MTREQKDRGARIRESYREIARISGDLSNAVLVDGGCPDQELLANTMLSCLEKTWAEFQQKKGPEAA